MSAIADDPFNLLNRRSSGRENDVFDFARSTFGEMGEIPQQKKSVQIVVIQHRDGRLELLRREDQVHVIPAKPDVRADLFFMLLDNAHRDRFDDPHGWASILS
ncbi:MAG: hypothetical protein ACKV2Q_01970 [Planctomycetaceae bacterium]